jgi:clan AA aspartic protease
MIRGKVTESRTVLIAFGIADHAGRLWSFEAALDTGFSGDLSLPYNVIERLKLSLSGQRSFILANGQGAVMNAYSGKIFWHEQLRDVIIIQTDDIPLVGMDLLWGNRLALDAVGDGNVVIEEIK